MTHDHQQADITWRGTVPVSVRFDDPYFSLDNGYAEAVHVFLNGNGLPARFRPGFHIAELGFGTGLNMAAALTAWRQAGVRGPLRYTGFEAYPLAPEALFEVLSARPEACGIAAPLAEVWARGETQLKTADLDLTLVFGDARTTLPQWEGNADAWFLDGFAPARNPELWQPELLAQVARHTVPGGSFASYTAAGAVRRALASTGFSVERLPGFGRKRHMIRGQLAGAD